MKGCSYQRQTSPKSLKRLEAQIRGLNLCGEVSQVLEGEDCGLSCKPIEEVKSDEFYLERLKQQRQKIEELSKDYAKKVEALAETDTELASLSAELSRLQGFKGEYQSLLNSLETQGYQLDSVRKDRDDLSSEVSTFRKLNLKARAKELSERVNCLKSCIDSLHINIIKLQSLSALALSEKNELTDATERELAQLRAREAAIKEELDVGAVQLQALQEENSKLEGSLSNLADEVNQQIIIFKEVEERNKQLEGQLQKLEDETDSAEKAGEANKADCYKNISALQIVEDKMSQLVKKLQSLVQEAGKRQKEGESRLKIQSGKADRAEELLGKVTEELAKKTNRVADLDSSTQQQRQEIALLKRQILSLEQFSNDHRRCEVTAKKYRYQVSLLKDDLRKRKRFEVQKIQAIVSNLTKLG